jgi:outer membrane protein OmpA-like peptidoglycan-associated protein
MLLVLATACSGGKGAAPAAEQPDPRRTVVTDTVVEILDPIQFDDAGALLPQSTQNLDAIAETLQGNPDIRRIEVQGRLPPDESHAGEREVRALERAEIVVAYLVEKQVDAARLVAKGYADPVVDPEASHVTLIILERDKQ